MPGTSRRALRDALPCRLRGVDLRIGPTAAGFAGVDVLERPSWREYERAMWEEAAALDPGYDVALRAFHEEGVRSLEIFSLARWVMATATVP